MTLKNINVLFLALFLFSTCYGKVYDCFTFFNEWEVLEIRLHELYDHVDKFVIVESCESFRGLPKSIRFEEKKDLYKKFANKIVYIKLKKPLPVTNDWVRENWQKNQIMRGLTHCDPDDLILFSDVDEIPPGHLIKDLAVAVKSTPVIGLRQRLYRFFLNRRAPNAGAGEAPGMWVGTLAIRFDYLKTHKPNSLRTNICFAPKRTVPIWEDGGWHFTSMGGFQRCLDKFTNWLHWKNHHPKTYQEWRNTVDTHPLVTIDDSYPAFVKRNISYLTKKGLIDTKA